MGELNEKSTLRCKWLIVDIFLKAVASKRGAIWTWRAIKKGDSFTLGGEKAAKMCRTLPQPHPTSSEDLTPLFPELDQPRPANSTGFTTEKSSSAARDCSSCKTWANSLLLLNLGIPVRMLGHLSSTGWCSSLSSSLSLVDRGGSAVFSVVFSCSAEVIV